MNAVSIRFWRNTLWRFFWNLSEMPYRCVGHSFRHVGKNFHLGYKVFFSGKKNINIGNDVIIKSRCYFYVGKQGLEIRDKCEIGENCLFRTYGGHIILGCNSSINFGGDIVGGVGGVQIGNNTRIGPYCVIVASSHNHSNTTIPIVNQGVSSQGIVIEDDVWLGARVTVLDGVQIGHGTIIGAGAVVTRSIPPYSVAVGVPARVIHSRLDQQLGGM